MGNYFTFPKEPQPARYTALLGPMLGGSFPASVAIYNVIKKSSDPVKLVVFGGLTLGVFATATGLSATSLGTETWMARYARFAALLAITIALSLFTGVLCTLFTGLWYKIGCATVFGLLILSIDFVWIIFKL